MLIRLVALIGRDLFRLLLLPCRSSRSKDIELLVLYQEVSVLRRKLNRPRIRPEERIVLSLFQRLRPTRERLSSLVTPDTLRPSRPPPGDPVQGPPQDHPSRCSRRHRPRIRARCLRHLPIGRTADGPRPLLPAPPDRVALSGADPVAHRSSNCDLYQPEDDFHLRRHWTCPNIWTLQVRL